MTTGAPLSPRAGMQACSLPQRLRYSVTGELTVAVEPLCRNTQRATVEGRLHAHTGQLVAHLTGSLPHEGHSWVWEFLLPLSCASLWGEVMRAKCRSSSYHFCMVILHFFHYTVVLYLLNSSPVLSQSYFHLWVAL